MAKLKLLLIWIIFICLIPFATTEKISEPIRLTVQCTNSTFANLTYVKYLANSTFLISTEQPMTQNGIYYNYTIVADNNTRIGTLEYAYRCDVNGIETSAGNTLFVSIMGEELTTAQGTLYVVILIGLLVVFVITIFAAVVFPWKDTRDEEGRIVNINDFKYIKVVLYVVVYLEGLFIATILKNLTGYLMAEGTHTFFRIIQTFLLIGLLPFFPLLVYITVVSWLSDKKNLQDIERGILPT